MRVILGTYRAGKGSVQHHSNSSVVSLKADDCHNMKNFSVLSFLG